MPLITLQGVDYSVGGPLLLEHVDLAIEAGERIALIGRNGAGKSTLLKLLAGELRPDDGEVRARLYRDDRHRASSKLPADFPVTGGTIEVATSGYGLRRCHYVRHDGAVQQLVPDPASAEGRRARLERDHPGASRAIGFVSWAVLVVALVLGVPQIVEQVSQIPLVAENVGTFASPIHLSGALNVGLVVATLLASTERALRLRYHWLLDGGLFDGDE